MRRCSCRKIWGQAGARLLRRFRRRCSVIQAGCGVASRQSWVEYRNRDLYLMKAVFGAVQAWLLQMLWLDPDETAYAAHITVWTRWFLWVGAMISLALRPTFTYPQSISQSIPFPGCWSSSTSDGMSSGCRCRTTGWGFPTTTRGGAMASQTCGRTPGVWADGLSSSPRDRPGARA